jgi:hypothetical protein
VVSESVCDSANGMKKLSETGRTVKTYIPDVSGGELMGKDVKDIAADLQASLGLRGNEPPINAAQQHKL